MAKLDDKLEVVSLEIHQLQRAQLDMFDEAIESPNLN